MLFTQTLLSGIVMGAIYGLVSMSLSMVYGVMKFTNFAHGALLSLGLYATMTFVNLLGVDAYFTAPLVIAFMFGFGYLLGIVIEKMLIKRKSTSGSSTWLLTVGISWVIINTIQLIYGPDNVMLKGLLSNKTIKIGGAIINASRLVAAVAAVACFALVSILMNRLKFGKAMRAVSQDMDAARLMGINERQVFRISFGITAALAGIAGLLITPFYYINPNAGTVFQLKSFVIVVLGGMGSIPGALVGGLLIGLFEAFAALALNVTYAQAIIYLLFLVILLILPKGLMGRE